MACVSQLPRLVCVLFGEKIGDVQLTEWYTFIYRSKLPSYRCNSLFTAVYSGKHAVSFDFTAFYGLQRNYFEKYIRYFSRYQLDKKRNEFLGYYRRKIQFNVDSLLEFVNCFCEVSFDIPIRFRG